MSDYGITIVPKTTGKTIDITSGMRSMKFLGNYNYKNLTEVTSSRSYIDLKSKTSGSDVYLVPVVAGTPLHPAVSSADYVFYISNYWVSGDRLWIDFNLKTESMDSFAKYIEFSVFEVIPKGTPALDYGIQLSDSTNFLELPDSSQTGCCVWAGSVTINGSWSAPSSIPNRANCVIFGNWSHSDHCLSFNNKNKTIYCHNSSGKSATVTAKIAVFSSGFYPQPPEFGVAIWNKAGNCTFSSDYPPIMLNRTVKLNQKPNIWVSTGVSSPLIPICSTGAAKSDRASMGYVDIQYCGIKMSGDKVCGGKGEYSGNSTEEKWHFEDGVSPIVIPVLDANNYF